MFAILVDNKIIEYAVEECAPLTYLLASLSILPRTQKCLLSQFKCALAVGESHMAVPEELVRMLFKHHRKLCLCIIHIPRRMRGCSLSSVYCRPCCVS